MKVAVISCINEFQSAYSIATMTEAKLKAFHLLGEDSEMVYICPKGGQVPTFWAGEVREFEQMIPLKDWYAEEVDEDFIPSLQPVASSFVKALDGIDVAIVEDMLLQGWYLPYLMGIRVAEKAYPALKVYFNNHSCPSARKDFDFPKSELMRVTSQEYILYNNQSDIPDEERMYNAHGRVFPIFNPIDIPMFNRFPKELEDFYYQYNLYDRDVICVYPARVAAGKQFDKWLCTLYGFKTAGAKVFGIIADSYGTGTEEVKIKETLKDIGNNTNFRHGEDWVFTSETIKGCELYCPHNFVSALMSISNLFIQTSISETYSLIMLEAMANKQHIILNEDLRYILTGEIGTWCQKAKYSSLLYKTSYRPSLQRYCFDVAKIAIDNMRKQGSIRNFVWASKNNNLIRYGRRLLALTGKEVVFDDLSSILLEDSKIQEPPAPPPIKFDGQRSGKIKL